MAKGKALHLILTHEQADFDAVASLLGARLLDQEAIPVLPRRLNRNVRAYLTLYGDELPFVEFNDLRKGPVDRIILVDTQSLQSVKGAHAGTQICVVDHHPPGPALDPTWETHIEEVGANTTLLVEVAQESGVDLDLVSATMLLLGIYEDTGSLTYASTTPRDLQAAGWLLEQGASLSIAADFLNHPLSGEQRRLYEHLLDMSETHIFHGISVVVAAARAQGMVDEISTLAHKLRDVFDPDGLFVLVALDGHIQMVARSTSDSLDVGTVAEHFGGGGHNRAAAALIRDRSLEQVRDDLLRLLPKFIRPPKTVGEIMSRDPQMLHPNDRIAEAARGMQRYGHEGYPVVEHGEVVGLLTRRAVDRAMAHGLGGRPVSSVMEAGNVVAHPGDSIPHLQRLMIEHGWGQIPVADPQSGEIIGIVTRTDVLQTLAEQQAGAKEPNLADKLERALPPARLLLLKLVARHAEERNDALFIVGGFVRDLLLGAPSVDFDLVVEGDAIGLARDLAAAYGGRVSSHRRFGTAKWRLDRRSPALLRALDGDGVSPDDLPASLDFVRARTEFYPHPTALPSVRRGSIKLDLHRRDFTINTLALRLDGRHYGQLLDHWGGGQDLRQGVIRVLHSLSFVDDPTRMLRAVRLEQRLGFKIEPRTLELLRQALPLLDRVSGERIRSELELIFKEDQREAIFRRLQELGLLAAIHPALRWDGWLEARFREAAAFRAPPEWKLESEPEREFLFYALLCFRLSEEDSQAIVARLHFPAAVGKAILQAGRLGRALPELRGAAPSVLTALMEDQREQALAAAHLGLADVPEAQQAVASYLERWRFVEPRTDGNALRALGLPPGPVYRRVLNRLRAAWLDGEITTEAQERRLLEQLVEEARSIG